MSVSFVLPVYFSVSASVVGEMSPNRTSKTENSDNLGFVNNIDLIGEKFVVNGQLPSAFELGSSVSFPSNNDFRWSKWEKRKLYSWNENYIHENLCFTLEMNSNNTIIQLEWAKENFNLPLSKFKVQNSEINSAFSD